MEKGPGSWSRERRWLELGRGVALPGMASHLLLGQLVTQPRRTRTWLWPLRHLGVFWAAMQMGWVPIVTRVMDGPEGEEESPLPSRQEGQQRQDAAWVPWLSRTRPSARRGLEEKPPSPPCSREKAGAVQAPE